MFKQTLLLILLFVIVFLASKPLFQNGFFPMHDDTQPARVIEMGKALGDGQFPVRWVADLGYGYGYPIYNFYAPLPYYFGGFLYLMGFDSLTATKTMIVFGFIIGTLSMFILGRRLYGIIGGLTIAVVFTFVPYHAVDIYVRGAIGEFWAMSLFPLYFYYLWKIYENKVSAVFVGGIVLAAIILSHTILGYVTVGITICGIIFSFLYNFIKKIHFQTSFKLLLLLIYGLSLSAFFWLPAISEMHLTRLAGLSWDKTNYRDHFICLNQLWNSPWGFGGSSPGCIDGMSFKIGKLHLILSLLGLFVIIYRRKHVLDNAKYILFGLTIISTLMTLSVSELIWRIIPFSDYIQYPWRFLSYATFGFSIFTGGLVLISTNKLIKISIALAIISGIIINNMKLFMPYYNNHLQSKDFENVADIKYRVSKISDEYLPSEIIRPEKSADIVKSTLNQTNDLLVEFEQENSISAKFPVIANREMQITLNKAFFPGWRYWVNNTEIIPQVAHGLPSFVIPKGSSVVQMKFTDTPIRRISNIISLFGIIIIIFYYGKKTVC
jgi:uncharacterized membrane protein